MENIYFVPRSFTRKKLKEALKNDLTEIFTS